MSLFNAHGFLRSPATLQCAGALLRELLCPCLSCGECVPQFVLSPTATGKHGGARVVEPQHYLLNQWPCGLMDKALVFGTKDCRFESCQGQVQVTMGAAHGVSQHTPHTLWWSPHSATQVHCLPSVKLAADWWMGGWPPCPAPCHCWHTCAGPLNVPLRLCAAHTGVPAVWQLLRRCHRGICLLCRMAWEHATRAADIGSTGT